MFEVWESGMQVYFPSPPPPNQLDFPVQFFFFFLFFWHFLLQIFVSRIVKKKRWTKRVPHSELRLQEKGGLSTERGIGKTNTKTQALEWTQSTRSSENPKCKWSRTRGDSMCERCFPALRHSTVEKFCCTLEPAALRSEPQKGQRSLK